MNAEYSPSFLVSSKIPSELYDEVVQIAAEESRRGKRQVTPEEVFRKAVKFYSGRCVHTHPAPRRTRRAKATRR